MKAAIIGSLDIECMGGGEANTVMFSNMLTDLGYEVTYFGSGCIEYGKRNSFQDIEMRFKYKPSSFLHDPMANPNILKISRLLSLGLFGFFSFRKTYKMLDGFDLYYFANPTLLSRRMIPKILGQNKKVIIANHGTFFEYLGNSNNFVLRALGTIAGKYLLEPLNIYRKNIVIHTQNNFQTEYYVKIGFQHKSIKEIPQHNIDFKRYYINQQKEGFSVAFLGRLTESKGIDVLIEVANMNPKIQFHIMGNGHMKNVVIASNKNHNIVMHGFVSNEEKQDILASCDAMFVPSKFESLSIASIEGLASGLPLVASQTAQGLRYIISKDPIFGRLLPRNAESFSSELRRLMRRKMEMYDDYIHERINIRESAIKIFDEKLLLTNLIKIIKFNIDSEIYEEKEIPEITVYT